VAKEAGFKVEFKNTAWDGIFAGLDTNNYDAVISSVTIISLCSGEEGRGRNGRHLASHGDAGCQQEHHRLRH